MLGRCKGEGLHLEEGPGTTYALTPLQAELRPPSMPCGYNSDSNLQCFWLVHDDWKIRQDTAKKIARVLKPRLLDLSSAQCSVDPIRGTGSTKPSADDENLSGPLATGITKETGVGNLSLA